MPIPASSRAPIPPIPAPVSAVPFAALRLGPADPLGADLRAGLVAAEGLVRRAAAGGVVDVTRPPFAVEGVRLHALLALLGSHHACRADPAAGALAAAVAELTHLFTRYHDAVPGASRAPARVRQQRLSRAVLAGDLLIVRASALAADLPGDGMHRWAAALRDVHEAKLVDRPDLAAGALRVAAFELGVQTGGGPAAAPPAAAVAAHAALGAHLSASAEPAALTGR